MLRQTVLANFQKIWAYLFTVGMILLSLFPVYWVLTVSLKSKRDSLANPLFGSSNRLHRAISSSGITTLSKKHFLIQSSSP